MADSGVGTGGGANSGRRHANSAQATHRLSRMRTKIRALKSSHARQNTRGGREGWGMALRLNC